MSVTKLGLECKLYYNAGTYGSPTWTLIDDVRDVTLTIEKTEADTSTRETTWGTVRGALKRATIDFAMVRDSGNTIWTAMRDAFLNGTSTEFAVVDGAIATTGTQGLRAICEVLKFDESQPLEGVVYSNVSAKPTRNVNGPSWFTAA